jgi:glycerol-3-phosphate dehydrogenase
MDDPTVKEICCPSSGVHIVLPGYYSPAQMGLLDPSTSDGRVIFFLPWQNQTIAGTTDLPCDITHSPKPTEDEIQFILTEIKNYLNKDVEVRRGDVLSAWSGIRPLVSDPNKGDTQSLARNHIVHVSGSNLVTIAGGKWTTYRAMAEHTIDAAIKACDLKPQYALSQTESIQAEGAHGWSPTMYIRLVQDFGLDVEVARHLAQSYGDRAFNVAKMAALTGKRWPIIGKKIHPEFPYIDAEVR